MSIIETIRTALYGSPPSQAYQPSKEGVIDAFDQVAQAVTVVSSGIVGSTATVRATKSQLLAVSAANNTLGLVYDDPDETKNGIYHRSGGVWVFTGLLGVGPEGPGPTSETITASTAIAVAAADDAETAAAAAVASASTAESLVGPTYASIAAGLAATASGGYFAVDNGDGTVTIYRDNSGVEVFQRSLFTTAAASASAGSGLVGWIQSGVGTVLRNILDKLRERRTFEDYGAVGDGVTDDTLAVQEAFDNAKSIRMSGKTYRVTAGLHIHRDSFSLVGVGDESRFYFDPTTSGETMLLLQNQDPAEVIKYIRLENFSFGAYYDPGIDPEDDETRDQKVGIKIVDGTQITISGVNTTDYSWKGGSGIGSIAFWFAGRDTHNFKNCRPLADQPVYIDLNPNSDEFTFDYHVWDHVLCVTLKNTNNAVEFAAGVNPTHWKVTGNCGAFQGRGGIHLDNSSVSDVMASSMIMIDGFRCESGSLSTGDVASEGGYGIYMNFGDDNPACGNIEIRNCPTNDPSCNGYYINNYGALIMDNVNAGFGAANNALILNNGLAARITNFAVGNPAATVQINGMYAQKVARFADKTAGDPSIAYGRYIGRSTDTPANNLTYRNGVRSWQRRQDTVNSDEIALPPLTAAESMIVTVSCNQGAAIYMFTFTTCLLVSGTAGFGVAGAGVISAVSNGAGSNKLVNVSGGSQRIYIVSNGQ